MKPTRSKMGRMAALLAACALVATACSIEAPDIELIGGGNGDAGGGAPIAIQPGDPAGGQQPGTQPGGPTVIGGGTAGGGTVGGGGSATQEDNSCLGKGVPGQNGITGSSIKLGSTFAVSGPVSNISGPILKGVQAYFNEVNAQGGIFGRKLELKWYDDGWDAQRGKSFIKKLVEQDKVFILTTAASSNGLDAAKTYLEQKRMPVIGTSGLIESQFQSPMQWSVGTSTKSASRISLLYMKERKVKNVAVIWLDLLAGRQAFEAIENGTQKIMGISPEDFLVNRQGYRVSISEPDFGPVWARVIDDTKSWQRDHGQTVDGRPDFVVLAIDPTNAVKALQAAENIGFRPRIGWGGGSPLFLDLVWQGSAYAAKTGLLAGTSYKPPIAEFANDPDVQAYTKAVRKYFGNDVDLNNPYLEGGYAGAAMTVEVLKRAGSCPTVEKIIKIADSLTNYSAAGLTKPMTFRPMGTGNGHYGNIYGITAKVSPQNKWVMERDFVADPTPGAE